jgi:hypothetical protein
MRAPPPRPIYFGLTTLVLTVAFLPLLYAYTWLQRHQRAQR